METTTRPIAPDQKVKTASTLRDPQPLLDAGVGVSLVDRRKPNTEGCVVMHVKSDEVDAWYVNHGHHEPAVYFTHELYPVE